MKWIATDDALCLYYELSDDLYEVIKRTPTYYLDRELLKKCDEAQGRHFHAILFVNHGHISVMYRELSKLRYKYKTISFWNREHLTFKEWKGKL